MTKVLNFKVYPDKDHLYKCPSFFQFVFCILFGIERNELILDIRKQ